MLRNESKHDIIIPAKSVIAEIHALQTVVPSNQGSPKVAHQDSPSKSPEDAKLKSNFDGSPLSAEWRERIEQKLGVTSAHGRQPSRGRHSP